MIHRVPRLVAPSIMARAPFAGGGGVRAIGGVGRPGGVLGTISDLSATAGDTQSILSWTAAANASSHQPQYRTTGSGTWLNFGSPLGGSATGTTVTGLVNTTDYDFRVVAGDGFTTTNSNVDTATPVAGAGGEPAYTGAANQTLILQADFENAELYENITQMGETDPSVVYSPTYDNTAFLTPYPSPEITGSWSDQSDFAILTPGRGGTGRCLRINRDGLSEGQGGIPSSWRTRNVTNVPAGLLTHYCSYWVRVNPPSNFGSFSIKWFWFTHDFNRCEFHLTYRLSQIYTLPDPATYWGVFDVGSMYENQQPISPRFDEIATPGSDWFRVTYAYRPHSGDGSAKDGFARMWVNGTLIVDVSQGAVDVFPPSSFGGKPWCKQSDVDTLRSETGTGNHTVNGLSWLSVQTTGSPGAYTVDIDDLDWWTEP